jgi:hypothetical protein
MVSGHTDTIDGIHTIESGVAINNLAVIIKNSGKSQTEENPTDAF